MNSVDSAGSKGFLNKQEVILYTDIASLIADKLADCLTKLEPARQLQTDTEMAIPCSGSDVQEETSRSNYRRAANALWDLDRLIEAYQTLLTSIEDDLSV